ncbi:hypothetical protein DUNSADRAFT_12238 [Dunaliella salina]|uniref:Glutamyl-tRNA synthetase n=1 Tax=Dunaliella salina TaxID=3046 RepID=A0ABQ7GBP0_DUNSA|nr:hypothetical protein DUNSADRAFT_12238 [Dunaliella salina]|eukprot:KAF5832022.1 hypothetical protein DUNSADRAFT_12238 [Dunaliella salina]
MTGYVMDLTKDGNPTLTEEVLIAARGQHVRRWTSPRNTYPEGKAAYLQWREDLKQMHAKTTGDIMREAGYPEDSAQKVEALIKKQLLKEPEGQVVEDALCLCFLEHQLAEFRLKETREKMVDILRKTWVRKMGEKGRAAALKLPLGPEELSLVKEALSA